MERSRSGDGPDRQQLLDDHPELADELGSFFANHDGMKVAAAEDAMLPPQPVGEDATVPPTPTSGDDATIPPHSPGSGVSGVDHRSDLSSSSLFGAIVSSQVKANGTAPKEGRA